MIREFFANLKTPALDYDFNLNIIASASYDKSINYGMG